MMMDKDIRNQMRPIDNRGEEIVLKAIEEIESKTRGVTQQFLDMHRPLINWTVF